MNALQARDTAVAGQPVRTSREDVLNVCRGLIKYATNHVIAHIPSHAVRLAWYRGALGWHIGPSSSILLGLRVQMAGLRTSGRQVHVGRNSVINNDCYLLVSGGIAIGDNVSISMGTALITGSHDINDPHFGDVFRKIEIQDYVWVGARCTILGGVTLGEGCVVMAGSTVIRDVPPYAIVSGVPARVVGERELKNPSYALSYRPFME